MPPSRVSLDDLFGSHGSAPRIHDAWEHRPEQLEMATAVLELFEHSPGVLAVEAPTGVGKTLAYLSAAVLSSRSVLIATHTKTQEDQIIRKDLPLLSRILAEHRVELVEASETSSPENLPSLSRVRFALMKGRNNYLCKYRLDRAIRSRTPSFFGQDPLLTIADWAEKTTTGDRIELGSLQEDDNTWQSVDARSDACIGSKCPVFEQCFVVRMRRRAENADLVIANHHLLLADLALGASRAFTGSTGVGRVLPKSEALVIDEAHALESAASGFFGREITLGKLDRLARDVSSHAAEWGGALGLRASADRVRAMAEAFFSLIPLPDDPEGRITFRPGDSAMGPKTNVAVCAALLDLAEQLDNHGPFASALSERARSLQETIRFLTERSNPDFVYFAQRKKTGVSLGAYPVETGPILESSLFAAFPRVVLTSATLVTQVAEPETGFEFFLSSVGARDAATLRLDTPFDFRSQAALYTPRNIPEPDRPGYLEAITRQIADLVTITGGGAFLLFTSHRAMRAVHSRLSRSFPHPVYCQGDAPKPTLLDAFVRNAPAVLFATASFWEGVDVPGDPLRLVVVDRLPFAPPNDPLVQSKVHRLESRGENAFAHFQLPDAVLRLKQAFGRLIRTRKDRGIVAVLDARITRRPYGQVFLRALPPARRLDTLPALEDWWHDQTPHYAQLEPSRGDFPGSETWMTD